MSYFAPTDPTRLSPPMPVVTRPGMPARLTSWDSLDDRVRDVSGVNPSIPLDVYERLGDGTYRRVQVAETVGTRAPVDTVVPVPASEPQQHRMGWRTMVQIYGVLVAMTTACIAAFNLYARTHNKPGFSANG